MEKPRLKVLTVVGTRPELIRLSRIISLFDKYFNHILIHTGQNYDYELNEIFFSDLEIRRPDYFLEIDTSSLGSAVGDIISKSEKVLLKEMPDALLVLGDTNSSLASYMAKRLHIPIFHMEAGNRSFDMNVPEEINRKIIDHIADFNLVYTEHARSHLIAEGLPHRRIYLTGSPMKEVLDYYKKKIEKSKVFEKLSILLRDENQSDAKGPEQYQSNQSGNMTIKKSGYFLISIHREENVDNPVNLEKILNILDQLAIKYELPIIVSTHPRTRKRLELLQKGKMHPGVYFLKPFSFTDYVYLQQNSLCVISDSGTISEESSILNFPAISIRQSMERPESQDAGTILLTGFDANIVLQSIELVIDEFQKRKSYHIPEEYKITDTSWRVLKLIMGNAGLSNKWWGIQ